MNMSVSIMKTTFKTYSEFLNEGKILTFYHGTRSENLDSIRKEGLSISAKTNKDTHGFNTRGQISLTGDYNQAFYYSSIFAKEGVPITILVIQLDYSDNKFENGISYREYVTKYDIDPKYIIGAYDERGKLIKLKDLESTINYIDFNRLTGSDLKVAKQYYMNEK